MSKKAREKRRRRRADIRLMQGRASDYDFMLVTFVTYWKRSKVRSIDRWSKSREGLLLESAGHEIEFILSNQVIHNGKKGRRWQK